jgi:hypothetical protein
MHINEFTYTSKLTLYPSDAFGNECCAPKHYPLQPIAEPAEQRRQYFGMNDRADYCSCTENTLGMKNKL